MLKLCYKLSQVLADGLMWEKHISTILSFVLQTQTLGLILLNKYQELLRILYYSTRELMCQLVTVSSIFVEDIETPPPGQK